MKTCSACRKPKQDSEFSEESGRCKPCYNANRKNGYRAKRGAGICYGCSSRPSLPGRSKCEACRQSLERLKNERAAKGLCRYCNHGNEAVAGSTRCETCLLKQKAMSHFGSSKKWTVLKSIWDKQHGICPYTAISLNLADADVDHIVPRAKNGTEDASNLQFVHRVANEMKRGHSEEQFLEWIRIIYTNSRFMHRLREAESPGSKSPGNPAEDN